MFYFNIIFQLSLTNFIVIDNLGGYFLWQLKIFN